MTRWNFVEGARVDARQFVASLAWPNVRAGLPRRTSASPSARTTTRRRSTRGSTRPTCRPTRPSRRPATVDRIIVGDARVDDRGADELGGAGRHLAAVLRRQGLRGGARRGRHPGHVPRLPADAARRVRRVRARARAGRPHRGERRQPRPPPVPIAGRRRHHHPAGRSAPAAARRDRVGEAARCVGLVRVGLVPAARQPGAARRQRAGDRAPARVASIARSTRKRAGAGTGCRRSAASPATSSWRPRSTCGRCRPRAPRGSGIRHRSRWRCPSG